MKRQDNSSVPFGEALRSNIGFGGSRVADNYQGSPLGQRAMNKSVSLPGLGHSGVSARVLSVASAHPDPWSEGKKVELIPGY